MVSYEPTRPEHLNRITYYNNEKKERSLHLWRFDGDEWRIATVKPLQVDYAMIGKNHQYFPWRYAAGDSKTKDKDGMFSSSLNGYVKKHPNGDVEIKLINIDYDKTRSNDIIFYNKIVILRPLDNEMYTVIDE